MGGPHLAVVRTECQAAPPPSGHPHQPDVAVDENFRLCPRSLSELAAADRARGLLPWLVLGSAGTADTGAIDPLDRIADIAEREGLWFHVERTPARPTPDHGSGCRRGLDPGLRWWHFSAWLRYVRPRTHSPLLSLCKASDRQRFAVTRAPRGISARSATVRRFSLAGRANPMRAERLQSLTQSLTLSSRAR